MRRFLFSPVRYFAADGGDGSGDDDSGGGGGGEPSPSVPRTELTKVIGQRDQFKTDLGARDTKIAEMQAQLDTRKKSDDDAESTRLKEQGKFDELLTKKADEFAASLKAKDVEIVAVHRSALRDKLRAHVAAAENVATSAVDDVTDLLLPRLEVDADNGYAPRVRAADGSPAIGADGKPLGLPDLVGSFLTDKPHYRIATGAIGPKAGAPGDKGVGGDVDRALSDPVYAEQWKKADPDGYSKAVADDAARRLTPGGLVAHDRKIAAAAAK